MSGKVINLVGQVFGRLTVIQQQGVNRKGNAVWSCICSCGNTVDISAQSLRSGATRSCGCLNREVHTKHGFKGSSVYKTWLNIKDRCGNLTGPDWVAYGGRGITVYKEWKDSFEAFWRDMGSTYQDGLSLDRIDVNGNYCKDNCRWTNLSVQSHNRRKRKDCSSQYIGVCFDKQSGMFRSGIMCCGNRERLGYFIDEVSAAIAYDNRSEELYGDRPNGTDRIIAIS